MTMTQKQIDEVVEKTVVEETEGIFHAQYGDFEGEGDTKENAISNLIFGIEMFNSYSEVFQS